VVNTTSGSSGTPENQQNWSSDNLARPRQATCKLCGLTARNQEELDDHLYHAHSKQNSKRK